MSKQIKDGGPAFPVPDSNSHGHVECSHIGMTLRDYFAGKAMQSFTQGAVLPPGFDATEGLALVAARAYEVADAMLAARSQP